MSDWYDDGFDEGSDDVGRIGDPFDEPEPEVGPDPAGARTNARLDSSGQGSAVGAAAGGSAGGDDKVVVWDFTALSGAAEQTARDALDDWVTTILQGWYDLVGEDQSKGTEYKRLRVPSCWSQHPDVVTELGWLAQTWHRAVRHDGGDLSAVAEWHTRYLPAAVERIRRASSACACFYQHTKLT